LSKKSKSKTVSTPWAPASPYILGAAQGVTDTVHANAGNLQHQEDQLNGMLPGLQSQAQGVAGQMQPGIGYANNVLGGKYLNANPYTQGLMQQAGNDAANHMNSTYSMAGRTGSNAAQSNLARGVDYAENQVGFQNYQNERGLQNNAAAMLPGLTERTVLWLPALSRRDPACRPASLLRRKHAGVGSWHVQRLRHADRNADAGRGNDARRHPRRGPRGLGIRRLQGGLTHGNVRQRRAA
jgi:hypothetical protein